jgi:hypothetical protein
MTTAADENNKLLEKFGKILKELTFHAREGSTCRHTVAQFLEEMEFG